MSANSPDELQRLYAERFGRAIAYRQAVWRVLVADYFQRWIAPTATVLDLGCGYGEFINQVRCGRKYAIDLNPDAPHRVAADVECLLQDCAAPWPLPADTLDVVFTSNFFEHLPNKSALDATVSEAHRCLKPGGKLIALGPNLRYLPGAYWDFWDHHLPLTDKSLTELLISRRYRIERSIPRFLPYTMAGGPEYPLGLVRLYLRLPWLWPLRGRQFLVVATK
jgi:SAM-dependent methyltransferase